MASDRTITIKIIDRLGEPIEYKNVRTHCVRTGSLNFITADGVEITTNAEFHMKEEPVKEKP